MDQIPFSNSAALLFSVNFALMYLLKVDDVVYNEHKPKYK